MLIRRENAAADLVGPTKNRRTIMVTRITRRSLSKLIYVFVIASLAVFPALAQNAAPNITEIPQLAQAPAPSPSPSPPAGQTCHQECTQQSNPAYVECLQ